MAFVATFEKKFHTHWHNLADKVSRNYKLASSLILNHTIMNIDRNEFHAWMERVMQRFDLLAEKILQVEQRHTAIDGEELLDNQDVLQMLKISSRSLQRYRSGGRLPYYTISGKLYYKLSDVHQFIRDSFQKRLPGLKAREWQAQHETAH
jgi:hypothetical protein